ncbi:MAG: sugar phosphate isomerase/epimerase family protein [Spirochaetaceae bacterium]|nr:sugar phosphate isomerase/epimerase [Spirochaetaceae bacterium]MDT8297035.1 sugar phosphate isomerase/epimerase family protein [Spirochaetaceae bacterium]
MISTLHGQVTLHANILSDVRIAKEAGYTALEVHTDKLTRYLNAGRTAQELRRALDGSGIQAAAIDIIGGIEVTGKDEKRALFQETETLCDVASVIGAPTVQVNAFSHLDGFDIDENIRITAENLKKIADIGSSRGIRFQIEGAAWTPIHTLEDCLRLIDAAGRDNVGLVIDFWHFWASRGAEPEDIAKLDSQIIYGVHVSDGYRPGIGEPWVDETELRGVLPGDGDIPVQEWMDAVKATGFDGFVSGEFLNPLLWERDHVEVATAMRLAMEKLF